MVFQLGDLIQGDCGNPEVHKKMLDDVMNRFKSELHGLPFVTVTGNHDIRGTNAKEAYHTYMPERMSEELGKPITHTNFFSRSAMMHILYWILMIRMIHSLIRC